MAFTPLNYGKERTGRLVIETEDMQWAYEVVGILPRYSPPKPDRSTIDNKLSLEASERITRRRVRSLHPKAD